MVQKNKSILSTLEDLFDQIQEKFYITPLIAGLVLLFLFGQFISAIGCLLIAWSRSAPNPHGNEMGFINGVRISIIGVLLIVLGLIF